MQNRETKKCTEKNTILQHHIKENVRDNLFRFSLNDILGERKKANCCCCFLERKSFKAINFLFGMFVCVFSAFCERWNLTKFEIS